MSVGIGIVTTALKIACALFAPNVFLQESFGTFIDEAAAYYSNSQETLTKKIEHVIKQETSSKRLEKYNVPPEVRDYVVTETKRLLEEVPVTIDVMSQKRFDNTSLANALLEQYEKECNKAQLEDRKYILSLMKAILPRLIACLSDDSTFLFNGLLLTRSSVEELSKKLKELQRQLPTTYQNKYPVYLSDRPYDRTEIFIGRQNIVQKIKDQLYKQSSLTISGIGGIGKTEIAKAVLNDIEKTACDVYKITHIAWVNYDNHDVNYSITKAFRETRDIEDYGKAWDKAYSIIQKYRHNLLLVIDNVETLEDDNLLRIADLPCRLLCTSRVDKISSIKTLKVDSLTIKECIELFLSHYKLRPAPRYNLQEIIKLADKHTVTIELLAKIAQVEELSLPVFHQKLIESGFNLSNEKAAAAHERLHKEDKIIRQLSVLFSVQGLTTTETDPVYKATDTEVAIAYRASLNMLIKQQAIDEAMGTLEQLRELTLQHPENTDVAVQYAKGLMDFSAIQSPEKTIRTLSEIFTLFGNYPDNVEIAKQAKESLNILYSNFLPSYDLIKLDPIKNNILFADYKLLIENEKYVNTMPNMIYGFKPFSRYMKNERVNNSIISMKELPRQLQNNRFVILCKMLFEEKYLIMNLSDSLRYSNDKKKKDEISTYVISLKDLQQQILKNSFYILPESSFVVQEIKTEEGK